MPQLLEKTSSTPMMRQYQRIKNLYNDCILFFRLGDFYEMFGDDAVTASQLLSITLTSRNKSDTDNMPMCGVPYHAANRYIVKLTSAGKKVAICEQMSDPTLPGIVERDVVKVITPGMTFDEHILDEKSNNFVISIYPKGDYFGFAYIDVTTGEFHAAEISGYATLHAELTRLSPRECVMHSSFLNDTSSQFQGFLKQFPNMYVYSHNSLEEPYIILTSHFKTQSLDGFGLEKRPLGIQAAGVLLDYVKSHQKAALYHIYRISTYSTDRFMHLDEATVRNLELFKTMYHGKREGSLLSILDATVTPMGSRLLAKWLFVPLIEAAHIIHRLEAVSELYDNQNIRMTLNDSLKNVCDIERILGRIGCGGENARDLVKLRESLKILPEIKQHLIGVASIMLKKLDKEISVFSELVDFLERTLENEPPLDTKQGGLIKKGYNQELDELRTISSEGKSYIFSLQEKERARTKIQSLKISYNRVFGYYIEVTKPNLHLVPSDYIRKQTMTNAERFVTSELKEYEDKVVHAEEKMLVLEYKLFCEIRDHVVTFSQRIQKTAHALSRLDVFLSFAHVALKYNYVKPEITEDNVAHIIEGRHPVLERASNFHYLENGLSSNINRTTFVPNDVSLDEKNHFILITGPNMAGKSTYLRQTALITLMAHLGSFVPAKSALIGVIDKIFTRVGASDYLLKGQSTFMVEMQEAAYILNHATEKSLVILDELGRGTSTYDGVSIAWAIMEYLHDRIRAKTLFATHYHELISLAEKLERASNYKVAVRENSQEGVVFLHKVVAGGSERSYGIEVAKLAGVPREVICKAQQILNELEEGILEKGIKQRLGDSNHRISVNQLNVLAEYPQYQETLQELKNLDVNKMTPVQALNKLSEMKQSL